ncbi:hypothetical protein CAPTEDRAFT_212759 [Capitella teleta]|uniref:Uncharacterized protein n=1 Tax=Capitella teleta TaxID=283909 RepID=R7UIZ0_CAPTE|nr:hypothetical protein CAPTEDRAFT_212759 [Capitella teleta]|eukprot:ELU06150.1 hypothetical protein CAPTEDRAFT_212759 [Capitella teleta]
MHFSILMIAAILFFHGVRCEKVEKAKKKEVSPVYVYKKLRQLEKKHAVTVELLSKAVERIDRLTSDVDTLLDEWAKSSLSTRVTRSISMTSMLFNGAALFRECYKTGRNVNLMQR